MALSRSRHQRADLGERHRAIEERERAVLLDLPSGAHEFSECGSVECRAKADPSSTGFGQLTDRGSLSALIGKTREDVHGLTHRLANRSNVLQSPDAGCVESV